MNLSFQCKHCGKSYACGPELAGRAIKCKGCGQVIPIPGGPPPPATDLDDLTDDAPARDQGLPARARAGSNRISDDSDSTHKARLLRGGFVGAVLLGAFLLGIFWHPEERPWRHPNEFDPGPVVMPQAPGDADVPFPAVPQAGGGGAGVPAEAAITPPPFPDPGPGVEVEPGVLFHQVSLGAERAGPGVPPGHSGKLWLYLPAGDHPPGSLPCVLIAPAGSNLITGNELGDGDGKHPEHLPYVRAGFAVLAYGLDGELRPRGPKPTPLELKQAAELFLAAQAGLVNARNALEYVLQKVPQVDPERIYAAGHSSAGTTALLFAENEPRIRACVAFAPCVDFEARFGGPMVQSLPLLVRGGDKFFTTYCPKVQEFRLNCPLFLFHALDDSNVPAQSSLECADRLRAMGKRVTQVTVPTGNHYDAMIRQGIPDAITWLQGLPASARPGWSPPSPSASGPEAEAPRPPDHSTPPGFRARMAPRLPPGARPVGPRLRRPR